MSQGKRPFQKRSFPDLLLPTLHWEYFCELRVRGSRVRAARAGREWGAPQGPPSGTAGGTPPEGTAGGTPGGGGVDLRLTLRKGSSRRT